MRRRKRFSRGNAFGGTHAGYFSKAKHLPAKTTDFIHFLQASVADRLSKDGK
jgi:hypothetical protein